MPSFRYGTGHIYNSYFKNANTGIDTRDGAQILVQSNVFSNVTQPIGALYSDVTGYDIYLPECLLDSTDKKIDM